MPQYAEAWKAYKRLQLIELFSLFPFVGLGIQKAVAPDWLAQQPHAVQTAVYFILLVSVIGFGVSILRLLFWRCSRCGKLFHKLDSSFFSLTKSCVHCGLRKWAQSGQD